MDINLIQNIVFAILFSYLIILVFKAVASVMKLLVFKLIIFLHSKKVIKNVDQEFINFLKGESNDK